MKALASLAIAIGIATSAGFAHPQDYGSQIYPFSIRSGETLVMRRVTSTSTGCAPMFNKVTAIDVLEAPPELSFKAENEMVHTSMNGRDCPKMVPGAAITATARGITEPKDAVVTLRVRMDTTNGPWQNTLRNHVFMYPGTPSKAGQENEQ